MKVSILVFCVKLITINHRTLRQLPHRDYFGTGHNCLNFMKRCIMGWKLSMWSYDTVIFSSLTNSNSSLFFINTLTSHQNILFSYHVEWLYLYAKYRILNATEKLKSVKINDSEWNARLQDTTFSSLMWV